MVLKVNVLELFAGSRSIGEEAEKLGYSVFSVDYKDFKNINLVKDIEFLTTKDIPFIPDIIWVSPPCTSYSIAAISHHRKGQIAISEFAKKSDRLIKNVIKLISEYPKAKYYIENPRGMLRNMDFMKQFDRVTITYCSYGDSRMKPTDIFTNNLISLFNVNGWNPLPMCWNGNLKCHHEPAPRGSKTGTQGLKDNFERSKIPLLLCKEIMVLKA